MDISRHMISWEKKLERKPIVQLIKTGFLLFSLSLIFGVMVSGGSYLLEIKANEKQVSDIKNLEKDRMDDRIKKIEETNYESDKKE